MNCANEQPAAVADKVLTAEEQALLDSVTAIQAATPNEWNDITPKLLVALLWYYATTAGTDFANFRGKVAIADKDKLHVEEGTIRTSKHGLILDTEHYDVPLRRNLNDIKIALPAAAIDKLISDAYTAQGKLLRKASGYWHDPIRFCVGAVVQIRPEFANLPALRELDVLPEQPCRVVDVRDPDSVESAADFSVGRNDLHVMIPYGNTVSVVATDSRLWQLSPLTVTADSGIVLWNDYDME